MQIETNMIGRPDAASAELRGQVEAFLAAAHQLGTADDAGLYMVAIASAGFRMMGDTAFLILQEMQRLRRSVDEMKAAAAIQPQAKKGK